VLATYAFGEIVSGILVNLDVVGGAAGYPVNTYIGLNVIAVVTLMVTITVIYLANTRFGLTVRAVHDDEPVASLFGVNVRLAKVAAFAIGAAIGGLAGALYAHHYNYIDVGSFNAALSIYVLLYVLIGGTQTPYGPVVGAAVFSLLPEVLRQSDRWRYVIFAAAIITLMAFRPEGLMTHALIKRVAFWRRASGRA
jgi:branched-chain amino acid transport system permease protein